MFTYLKSFFRRKLNLYVFLNILNKHEHWSFSLSWMKLTNSLRPQGIAIYLWCLSIIPFKLTVLIFKPICSNFQVSRRRQSVPTLAYWSDISHPSWPSKIGSRVYEDGYLSARATDRSIKYRAHFDPHATSKGAYWILNLTVEMCQSAV